VDCGPKVQGGERAGAANRVAPKSAGAAGTPAQATPAAATPATATAATAVAAMVVNREAASATVPAAANGPGTCRLCGCYRCGPALTPGRGWPGLNNATDIRVPCVLSPPPLHLPSPVIPLLLLVAICFPLLSPSLSLSPPLSTSPSRLSFETSSPVVCPVSLFSLHLSPSSSSCY
jgi:hypothetical protein